MYLSMGEHTATHVDAPSHFDPDKDAFSIDMVPLENFYTSGICLDLSHKPLKSNITIEDLIEAEKASGEKIMSGDTVLLHMIHY